MHVPESLYQSTDRWPAHLSVCVVLLDKDQVALHHWATSIWGDDVYTLMRETLHDHETLEAAAARGLMEELGATAKLIAYLGTEAKTFRVAAEAGKTFRKATPTFLARVIDLDPQRKLILGDDASDLDRHEQEAELVWVSLAQAAKLMQEQAERFPDRPDLDESEPIRWAQQYLALEAKGKAASQ
jgi:8-oxo-dGTP pyrophosphatase MutT (NUDIX family)